MTMERYPDGARVTVDGSRGIVTIHGVGDGAGAVDIESPRER
jgi:hypothetical protein